jgi:hypothetical protein
MACVGGETVANGDKIAVLTLVSNVKGSGPGHSAIVASGKTSSKVATFEEIGGAATTGTAWMIIDTKSYLLKNTHRPVVVQELNEKVRPLDVMGYVLGSMKRREGFLSSGVCSTQVARAIDAGTVKEFDAKGIDTPRQVYLLIKHRGLAKSTYYYWPAASESELGDAFSTLQNRMATDYAGVPEAALNAGVASW